ncbi:MAG: hypothetical protein H7Z43_05520 [Clostridia bacterium]|nr:hypothetical protein [Deltaproteobacteria bacterium]
MELDEPAKPFDLRPDTRPRVPEPLPVKLIAVADMRIEAAAGLERKLNEFYVGLLGMQRLTGNAIAYRTETFDLYVDVLEPIIERDDYRPVPIQIPSLAEMERKLIEAKIEYVRQKGMVAGEEFLLLQDPGGNWVELSQVRLIG